ncbi:hypothetical protein Mycch_1748 [Mycolicibacterium chubuense NBB4]|uniref:Uncharacterized protein n=1 Tax=Mycolicibacterium chubuense (strain NBB4) TaxID=710421 RepID=I4BGY2_MYCCN|nr:hypothetical protein [Mycolicibacterium chubuense]AFM16539.1 hypothetical protein Mycch_1748 [Mycolicibacterium chubuense NBB4]
MNAGSYVGRIGGLAVALGVGAAVFTGNGVAWADSTGSDSSTSNTGGPGTSTGTGSESGKDTAKTSTSDSTGSDSTTKSDSKKDSTSTDDAAADDSGTDAGTGKKGRHGLFSGLFSGHRADSGSSDQPDADQGATDTPAKGTDTSSTPDPTPQPRKFRWTPAPTETKTSTTSTTDANSSTGAEQAVAEKPAPKKSLFTVKLNVPEAAKTTTTPLTTTQASTKETVATAVTTESATTAAVATPLATFVKNLFDAFSGNSPAAPAAGGPLSWIMAAASRRELAANAQTTDNTMVWNGYQVVPVGEPLMSQYYGMFSNVPAFGGLQGQQDFQLVKNGETVATFHGLVTRNNDLGAGQKLVQIVVLDITSNPGGADVGVKPGDIPPVGSVFSSFGNGRSGYVYSALAQPGADVVTYNYVTPFGSRPLHATYSAADFLTDYEGVNRPIYTADGYYVAPVENNTMTFTGITGLQPFFTALQGTQTFGVYDKQTKELLGTFDGVVTVTSDFWGTTSEAILVTNSQGDVGTKPGQLPPYGTVYNVIYWQDPTSYLLYTSKPTTPGSPSVTRTVQVTGSKVQRLPFTFDASTPPQRDQIKIPGAYTFVPTSDVIYSGINGLPPRESIVQGYRQFDVLDAKGTKIGSVDAIVTSQWDLFGNSTEAILVTNVTDGQMGTAKGEVPPIGSVFNLNYVGPFGFGQAYYSLPTDSGDKVSYQLMTPFGGIPLLSFYDGAKDFNNYDYSNPFTYQNANPMALGAGAAAGVLGSDQMLCVLGSTCDVSAA